MSAASGPVDPAAVLALRAALDRYPRTIGGGYYLLRVIDAVDPGDDDLALHALFARLDDKPWPAVPDPRATGTWLDDQVDEAVARDAALTALTGGLEVGHSRVTIGERDALALWHQFRAFFSPAVRWFRCDFVFGELEGHIFSSGAVAVDRTRAGILHVIEND